jgi:crotonobetainyl-CoA:carnitine CoA-transferase CaiB-like acyl-CoA transferase
MKKPEALAVARRLCAASDVVVENFASGVMDRMGLGYEVLRTLRPDVIMIALSSYGATGPDADKVSYGPAQVPLSGMSSLTGYRDFPPMHVGISYGDPTGGLHGAVAVLAALMHRARTGEGQYIDLSQRETSIAVLGEGILAQTMTGAVPARDGNRVPHMAPHDVFRAEGEDRWIAIAVEDDAGWARFAGCIGRPELATDPRFTTLAARKRNEDVLTEIVAAWTATRTPEDATATLQAAGIAAFASARNNDLAESPHLRERGYFVELDHPEVDAASTPASLADDDERGRVRKAAPCLGADTDQVLRDVCGYDDAAIAALRAADVLN